MGYIFLINVYYIKFKILFYALYLLKVRISVDKYGFCMYIYMVGWKWLLYKNLTIITMVSNNFLFIINLKYYRNIL